MLQAKDRWLKHGGMENYVVIGHSLKTYFKSAKYLHRLLTLKLDLQNVGPRIYGHPAYLDAKSQSVFVHLTEVPLYVTECFLPFANIFPLICVAEYKEAMPKHTYQ